MTRILLIQPFVSEYYITNERLVPLGLLSICSYLEERGIENCLFDCLRNSRKELKLPDFYPSYKISKKNQNDQNPFNFFSKYYQYGNDSGLFETIQKFKPDIIGLSMNFSAYASDSAVLLKKLKNRFRDITFIAGGWHITYLKEKAIELYPELDFVISGPGEKPVYELIKYINGDLEQLPDCVYSKEREQIYSNELWNNEFYCKRKFIDNYTIFGKKSHTLVATRGCMNSCNFCVMSVFGNGVYFKRKIEDIIFEMTVAYEKGIRYFNFEDDNITTDRDFINKLLNRIINCFNDISLFAMNGIEYSTLDFELLNLMKKAGFQNLNLSIAIKSETVLKKMNRPFQTDKIYDVVKDSKKLKFNTTVYFICGSPDTNLQDSIETLEYLITMPVLIGLSLFYKVPGTDSFKIETDDFNLCRGTAMYTEESWADPDTLNELFIISRFFNYLKSVIDRGDDITYDQISKGKHKKKCSDVKLKKIAAYNLIKFGDNVRIYCNKNKDEGTYQYKYETYPNNSYRKYFLDSDILVSGYKSNDSRKLRDFIN